jgi:hypothetical protein
MRPPSSTLLPAALVMVALGLSACDRGDKTPPRPVAAAPAPAPAPPPAPLPPPPAPLPEGQPAFPPAGTPYPQARIQLIGQGMVPYVFAAGAGAPGHPECARKQKQCVFISTDKSGFASYLLVTTDPGFGAVEIVGFATQEEERALNLSPLNLPPVPAADLAPAINPYARDSGRAGWTTQRLPSLSGPYASAREKLIAAGFTPIPGKASTCKPPKPPPAPAAPGSPGAAPLPPLTSPEPVACRPPGAPPEIHGCVFSGLSACQAVWARDNQTLVVNTQGDPAPGSVDNMYWATPAEAADFRAGRK